MSPRGVTSLGQGWIEANPLRLWRKEHGYSAVAVARLLEVTDATVQAWESGRRYPGPENMYQLLLYTRCSDLPTWWLRWYALAKGLTDGATADELSNLWPELAEIAREEGLLGHGVR